MSFPPPAPPFRQLWRRYRYRPVQAVKDYVHWVSLAVRPLPTPPELLQKEKETFTFHSPREMIRAFPISVQLYKMTWTDQERYMRLMDRRDGMTFEEFRRHVYMSSEQEARMDKLDRTRRIGSIRRPIPKKDAVPVLDDIEKLNIKATDIVNEENVNRGMEMAKSALAVLKDILFSFVGGYREGRTEEQHKIDAGEKFVELPQQAKDFLGVKQPTNKRTRRQRQPTVTSKKPKEATEIIRSKLAATIQKKQY